MRSLSFIGVLANLFLCTTLYAEGPSQDDPADFFLARPLTPPTLRIMNWNVHRNSILSPSGSRHAPFRRMLRAIRPDVICLQEVHGPKVVTLPALLDQELPLSNGQHWQLHHDPQSDNAILSRFQPTMKYHEAVVPIPNTDPPVHLGFAGCLIRPSPSANLGPVYVITAHFRSSGLNGSEDRQRHADAIMRHLRRLRAAESDASMPSHTPIVILGDMNVYALEPMDTAHHLTTLLTGNIINEEEFGADLTPDWNGKFLIEVKPRHNATGKDWYTWRSDRERFAPGTLDRIIYTGSVLNAEHSFVLNTTTMTQQDLQQSGLLTTDVLLEAQPGNFDHLPMVVDFSFRDADPAAQATSDSPTEDQ